MGGWGGGGAASFTHNVISSPLLRDGAQPHVLGFVFAGLRFEASKRQIPYLCNVCICQLQIQLL